MKKIAVITGASSGMGKRFAETIDQFGTFDEVWVIARQWDKLEALRDTVPFPIRVLAMDLIYTIGMLVLLVLAIRYRSAVYFEAALLIALFGFISATAMAKFLLRGEVIE